MRSESINARAGTQNSRLEDRHVFPEPTQVFANPPIRMQRHTGGNSWPDERRFRFRCAPKQTTQQCEGNEHRSICAVRNGTRLVTSAVRWSDCHHHRRAHSAGVTEREGSLRLTLFTIAARRVNTFFAHVTKKRSHRPAFHRRPHTSVPNAERTARELSDNPATRHWSTGVAKRVGMCGRVV